MTAAAAIVLVSALLVIGAGQSSAASGTTERLSVSSRGVAGNGVSYVGSTSSVSEDGRYVAFTSSASNLVAGDTNGIDDVFVRDRLTGATERVSVSSSGAQATVLESRFPTISADGRYVAFDTFSPLVKGDTNDEDDVYVRDRVARTTERVSVSNSGAQGTGGGGSGVPAMSADGRFVAFESSDTNLVAGDTNGANDIFVRDRVANTTERVSVSGTGAQADLDSYTPAISGDGSVIAFWSFASNLVVGDTNQEPDVFARDLKSATTERVSVSSSGAQADGGDYPAISADGRFVTFESDAANLIATDTNNAEDVFVRDRVAGTTQRVSVSSSGAQGNLSSYGSAPISANGRFIAFASYASNLVSGDGNDTGDVFVRDTVARATALLSVSSSGLQGNQDSAFVSAMSGDGRFVAFSSEATNLVAGDTNGVRDVFMRDRGSTPSLPVCAGRPATMVGSEGADTMIGTSSADVIVALGGKDTISGRGGNDVICSGRGHDTIYGGAGSDRINAGRDDDRLYGATGNDHLYGGRGDDLIDGGANRDACWGGRGFNEAVNCERTTGIP